MTSMRPGPAAMTTMRVAKYTASTMLWVTMTIVRRGWFGSAKSRPISFRRVSAVRTSRALKGSSSASTSGSAISARAMPTRCFIPPESSRGYACS